MMTGDEEFLQFLDPELCTLKETHEKGSYRTLDFTYMFQDLHEDKQLFRIGNKVWVSGDNNLTDCLYVINTPVETDVYANNSFHVELEEVLVELNYAPVTTQNELTASNGFHITTSNGQKAVLVDWNAIHYWFSDYYNIGVVQDCLNSSVNRINFTGTMTLMALLRYIEEETGNIFVTRYEKDVLNNTIHRYLDFLNPISVSKNWKLNIEYDFINEDTTGDGVYDEDGNPTTDDYDDVYEEDDIVEWDEDQTPLRNIDPTTTQLQICNSEGYIINSDGEIFEDNDDTPLVWEAERVGFDGTEEYIVLSLSYTNGTIGLIVNNKSFIVPSADNSCGAQPKSFINIESDPTETIDDCIIPDDSYFEIYDTEHNVTVYRTCINREIGHVHEEILDFGFNLENVIFETDEVDTFNAICPVLDFDDSDTLNSTDISNLISSWQNLSVSKGTYVPMIIEKITVQAASLSAATSSLGTYNVGSNWYARPYHPQDNIDSNTPANSTWEFLRATAYWKAPFNKHSGDLHITNEAYNENEYNTVYGRNDIRDDYALNHPKMGTVETSAENAAIIYNDVALKLKEKMNREFNITVDVANLRHGQYNDYELHDKVYVKLPDYQELVTARVVKTEKEAHDVAKNTIELSNYNTNNIKVEEKETAINATNTSYKYPKEVEYKVRLENLAYDSQDPYSIQYPANKMLSFTLWSIDDNDTATLTKTSYNKLTDANGYATIMMRYDPGNYELHINFGGDEEYESSTRTVKINVSGVKTVTGKGTDTKKYIPVGLNAKPTSTKQKTTKKTSSKKKTVKNIKRYYTKYGVSPDGKYLMAIGRASAGGELAKYGYKWYKTIFYRKCPFCGSKELYWNIFWAGNEKASWGNNPAVNRRKGGALEGEITCKKCDADFSIFGKDKATTPRKNLKVYKKATKSTKTEAYTLKKGKMYYDTIQKVIKEKKVEDKQESRPTSTYTINKNLKQLALSIVGNSTGLAAAKKIAAWCGKRSNLDYHNYKNFRRSPKRVLNKKGANCCDSTRFMFTLMSAAGCEDTLKLEYVHTKNGKYGHVFGKITTRESGKWRYVDPVLKSRAPWGHHLNNPKYGSLPGTIRAFAGPDVPNIWWN